MALSFHCRTVGEATVVTCAGRIVAGEETAAFETQLDALMVNPLILLHLGAIDFIDSAGFGLLVRYVTRAQNASGALRICAVSPAIERVLQVTRLKSVLQPYDTDTQALADVHRAAGALDGPGVLCVDESEDVLAYLRQLLKQNGLRPMTAANLPDALILLTATRPRVVVIGSSLRAVAGTRSADEFHRVAAGCTVVPLPPGFAGQEASDAAEHVLAAVRAVARR